MNPFYHVVRGSDLGPGGAETLHEQMTERHVRFDLAARKQAGRDIKTTIIKSLGPCVKLDRAPSTKLTKKGKPYRKDLYIKVQYHTDVARNPLAGKEGYPNIEWLSRTELEQFVGKNYWEIQEKVMMAKYMKRKVVFAQLKSRNLHPDTKKPLVDQDRQDMPWLFPDAERAIPQQPDPTQEEDDVETGMDGVEVDGTSEHGKSDM